MFILMATVFIVIIILLIIRGRRGGGFGVDEGIKKIIASTGDVSGGMAGVKKLKYLRTPAEALVFLKVEENAIQQALSAVNYYVQQGEIDESLKTKFVQTYQDRLEAVQAAIAKDEEFKEIVDTSSAVDRARSDYLQKLAAMSGTTVETDDDDKAGPSSVGMPETATTTAPSGGAPNGGAPSSGAPSGGPPNGAVDLQVVELLVAAFQAVDLQVVELLVAAFQAVDLQVVEPPAAVLPEAVLLVAMHQNQLVERVHSSLRCFRKWNVLRHSWVGTSTILANSVQF